MTELKETPQMLTPQHVDTALRVWVLLVEVGNQAEDEAHMLRRQESWNLVFDDLIGPLNSPVLDFLILEVTTSL